MEPKAKKRSLNLASSDKPFSGLFGDNALTRIVQEIVADPYTYYRPKDFEEITMSSAPSVRKALKSLTSLGLLKKDAKDPQHPIYQPNLDSNTLLALTFLSYAMIDDGEGTDCLKTAVSDHYERSLGDKSTLSVSSSQDSEISLDKIIVKLSNGKDICFSCETANGQKSNI